MHTPGSQRQRCLPPARCARRAAAPCPALRDATLCRLAARDVTPRRVADGESVEPQSVAHRPRPATRRLLKDFSSEASRGIATDCRLAARAEFHRRRAPPRRRTVGVASSAVAVAARPAIAPRATATTYHTSHRRHASRLLLYCTVLTILSKQSGTPRTREFKPNISNELK